MEAEGYQYGEDALEQVRLGWDLRSKDIQESWRTEDDANARLIELATEAHGVIGDLRATLKRLGL